MSNRKQRRKEKEYGNKKIYNTYKLSEETKHGLIIALIIAAIVAGVYFATIYLVNNGNLSNYEPGNTADAIITYENINVGMVFNRFPDEYYVAFEDFGDKNKVQYNTIITSYTAKEKSLPIYKVDMTLKYNAKYASSDSNKYAQDARELAITTPTLIKIENGKNILYLEDLNEIKSELGN